MLSSNFTIISILQFSIADLATNSCVIKRATNHKGITCSMGVVSGAFRETKLSVSASFVTERRYPKGVAKGLRGDTMAHAFRTCATYPILSLSLSLL